MDGPTIPKAEGLTVGEMMNFGTDAYVSYRCERHRADELAALIKVQGK